MRIKVKLEDQVFTVDVGNLRERPIIAVVDEQTFEVWPETNQAYSTFAPGRAKQLVPESVSAKRAQVAPPPPSPKPAVTQATESSPPEALKSVRAPIPGVITAIAVQPGAEVSAGQELCKLEAMKMNNSIRASRAGRVSAIYISIGQQVKHGEVLLEFSD